MKKIILTLALIAFASTAFATTTAQFGATLASTIGVPGFNPSKNVELGYISDAAAGAGSMYGISSKHTQGNVVYGSTSGSTTIFKKDGAAGTTLTTDGSVPAASSDTSIPSGWSSM